MCVQLFLFNSSSSTQRPPPLNPNPWTPPLLDPKTPPPTPTLDPQTLKLYPPWLLKSSSPFVCARVHVQFVGLFSDCERSGNYELVKPALVALEALGSAIEEQLHLLLPALVRLINPGQSSTPVEIRRSALR